MSNTLKSLIAGCILIPESPVWLKSKGKHVASLQASTWLHLTIDKKDKLESGREVFKGEAFLYLESVRFRNN